MKSSFVLILTLAFGCKIEGSKTPKGAFAQIAHCIDKEDAQCLFECLDRNSRWSVQTIHKTLVELRDIVEKSYPKEAREGSFGVWQNEAMAKTPEELFEIYCKKKKCLSLIAKNFSAVSETMQKGADRVLLKTIRGGEYEMFFGDNRWGLAMFEAELHEAKIRIHDKALQIRKNADAFEEQRAAGAMPDKNTN